MRKKYLFYILLVTINLLPVVPMSIKGITGLAFIAVSSVEAGVKSGLKTAGVLILIDSLYYINGINVDLKYAFASMPLGTAAYLFTAYFLGYRTEKLLKKNELLLHEIEARKKTEEELIERNAILQSLMSSLPIPICIKDLEGRYVGCNHAFAQWFGCDEEELSGKNVFDLMEPEQAMVYNSMDLELLRKQTPQVKETFAKPLDGTTRNVICLKAVIVNEEERPSGIVVVMHDITDHKEREKSKLSMIEEELVLNEMKKYDRLKTDFFMNVSHELRTPLNVILGAIQLMELQNAGCETVRADKLKKNIMSIKQNSLRLLRLVNNLLDASKIDDHIYEIRCKNWNIVYLVEEIVLSVADYAKIKGIHLEFDTEFEEKVIACDEEKIERIMLNLLSNAIKFTPNGGRIFVNIGSKEDFLYIKVSDTGTGIPAEKQMGLFQRFFQASPMLTRTHEGSGIGLSLVKSLVEVHGGSISVESEEGAGTTFSVYLPDRILEEHEVTTANTVVNRMSFEKIQLELSDIYSARESMIS